MPFALSEKTADEIRDLIDARPGSSGGSSAPTGVRQVLWVSVSYERTEEPRTYSGVVQAYDAEASSWKTYGTIFTRDANGEKLTVGKRYLGIKHGLDEDGNIWFVVWSPTPRECLNVVTDVADDGAGGVIVTKRCIEFVGKLDSDCCDSTSMAMGSPEHDDFVKAYWAERGVHPPIPPSVARLHPQQQKAIRELPRQ